MISAPFQLHLGRCRYSMPYLHARVDDSRTGDGDVIKTRQIVVVLDDIGLMVRKDSACAGDGHLGVAACAGQGEAKLQLP